MYVKCWLFASEPNVSNLTWTMLYLASDVLLGQQVLALVVEDDMYLLGARPADVWAKHDEVGGISMHVFLVQVAREQLGVTTTAVDVLFVFHGELDDQRALLVGEGLVKLSGETVESGILAGLNTCRIQQIKELTLVVYGWNI